MRQILALVLIGGGIGNTAFPQAATTPPPVKPAVRIPRVATPPKIEEFLNGSFRQDMLRVDDFRQRHPGDGEPVSQRTSAWVGYDDKNFYAIFVCKSPPGGIRASLGKREDLFNDDIVGVFLDTYHDRQRSYEFFVNAYGVQADGIVNEGQNDDFSFDTLWYSDGRITLDGYVASLTIPFRSLRFSNADGQTWGFGLGRFIPSNNESSFWPFVTQKVSGFTPQLGNASGLENISPGRNIQLIPYGTLGQQHYLDNPGTNGANPMYRSQTDARVGLDAKMVLHDTMTLDIALKPDFSQVESDDPQVTVNQRYAVQFNEKRPFFLENSGFFQTPETLFFSRQIIDPQYGARLTGKLGRWDLGFLTMDDRAAGILAGPADPNYNGSAEIGVARVQREFAKDSSIGILLTDREFAGSYNRVGAVDTKLRLNTNWTFTGQFIDSTSRSYALGAPSVRSGGDAWVGTLSARHRKYFFNLTYIDRAEGFAANLGFITRTNIRQIQQFGNYRFYRKNSRIVSFGPQFSFTGDVDHRGVQQDWSVHPGFQMEMARSTYLGVNYESAFERYSGINFRRGGWGTGGHSEYFRKAILDWGYSQGTRINYSPAGNLNPFRGHGNELQATLTFRPVSRLKIDEIYYLTRLRTDANSFAAWSSPPVAQPVGVFVNHLWRSRATYQFNRQLSLRAIVDYSATLQNSALISLNRQKALTGDLLLTWLLHPGTAVYLGYTDRLENALLVGGNPNTVLQTNFPSATTERQIFVKVSYLFRF